MRRSIIACLALAVAAALGAPTRASTLFAASLNAAQEGGSDTSTATGFGTLMLNDAMDQITVNESWSGLTAPATASHIHTAPAGVNGPVTFPFSGVPSATAGSIPEQSFPINATQLANLQSGHLYFNIHTSTYPGGEIRGQIGPAVPEPGSLALLLTAAPAGLWMVRRRRTA